MEQRKTKRREPASAVKTEQLLASRYSQLLKWAVVLTLGDDGKAQDIVQEFCLYFILTKPDLSAVANLDGYLYTCLRHIYLSRLARSSREAQHFIHVGEFDSFESAIASNQSGDPLQRQNDLRRICTYAVWRKETSKTASYFIFHFFHGYSRREIAELARLPIAAIYNKLKIARAEVKSHLEEPGKLRVMNRELPPEPAFSWGLSSSSELFREFRKTILNARRSNCLPEDELLDQYRSPAATPISCALLAHLVSCERCIAIVDRHFRRPTLVDREPLDGFGSSSGSGNDMITAPKDLGYDAMVRSIRKRWSSVHEHRPKTLSIAVNGRIIAFHDVQAEHSALSARIEHPETAQFIEVFSEQDVRLALLSVGDLPPDGPHTYTQRVALSDSRWLELNLSFDGLGLNSQVAYFDPALAATIEEIEEYDAAWVPQLTDAGPLAIGRSITSRIAAALSRFTRLLVPSCAMAWALILAVIIGATGYMAYRHVNTPISAREALNRSVAIETASLHGQTEHQVVQLEEVSANGGVLRQGTVDLLKDGDGGRYLRRLYDSRHRLIAAEWRNKNGEHSLHSRQRDKSASDTHHPFSMNGLWDQDLSARSFSELRGKGTQIHLVEAGYELTTVGPIEGRPRLVSATLVLDRRFIPVREIMRVRAGIEVHEIRFVQTSYERRPSVSVPDTVFDPRYESQSSDNLHSSVPQQGGLPDTLATNVLLARLQIAVLDRLYTLGSDTGEPIEVVRTPDERIRVSGTVADSLLRQKIISALKSLEDHQLLDLRIVSPRDVEVHPYDVQRVTPEDTSVYEVGQSQPVADAALRRYLQSKGVSAGQLDSAAGQFSKDALQRAQTALQHAYALNRLSNALSATELKSIGPSSQRQWAEMVHSHAADLEGQLRALHDQLAKLMKRGEEVPVAGTPLVRIENPDQFNQVANQLLRKAEDLNNDVGRLFTKNSLGEKQPDQDSLLMTTLNAIPLRQAEEITRFSLELKASGESAPEDRTNSGNDKEVLEHSR